MKKNLLISIISSLPCLLMAKPSCCDVSNLPAPDSDSGKHDHAALASLSAPVSVMGDHTHPEGEFMLSYRYMFMDMDGMRNGDSSVSSTDLFAAGYNVAPTRMTMDMHMLGFMYAPTDQWTLMAMAGYKTIEMDHQILVAPLVNANGGSDRFTTKTQGWGDLKLSAIRQLWNSGHTHLNFAFGVSLPTGSIGERDVIPVPMVGRREAQLPAPMQLGSGTFDFLPKLTYEGHTESYGYGVQADAVVRTGKNSHNYRLGNQYGLQGWLTRKLAEWASMSGRLAYRYEAELHDQQSDVMLTAGTRRTVPTVFGENYGGERLDIAFGGSVNAPSGRLKGHRVAFEIALPLWEKANGYRLETDYTVTTGWQFVW